MLSSEELLEEASKSGIFDSEPWPQVLQDVLTRLETIVYNDFPIPSTSPPKKLSSPFRSPPPPQPAAHSTSSPNPTASPPKSTETETSPANADTSAPPSSPPDALAEENEAPALNEQPEPQPAEPQTPTQLPPELLFRYNFVRRVLTTQFALHPPHTIQRLAELILRPKEHYKFLHAYLNALDRVISVSSGANIFPLPPVETSQKTVIQVNGENALSQDIEELGGAVLSPIPWLKDTRSEPNGDSEDEGQEEERAITQGELLRQQQEQSSPPEPVVHAPVPGEVGEGETSVDPAEQPHATGPVEIGAEDMGPQHSAVGGAQILDMEAAVGRPLKSPPATEGEEEEDEPANGKTKEEEEADSIDNEGDVTLQDANDASKAEDEEILDKKVEEDDGPVKEDGEP